MRAGWSSCKNFRAGRCSGGEEEETRPRPGRMRVCCSKHARTVTRRRAATESAAGCGKIGCSRFHMSKKINALPLRGWVVRKLRSFANYLPPLE
jgi:hypothetical protein